MLAELILQVQVSFMLEESSLMVQIQLFPAEMTFVHRTLVQVEKLVMQITMLEQRKKSFKKFPHSRNFVEISKTISFFVQSRTFFIFASCMFFVGYWLVCPTLSGGQGLLLIDVLIDELLKNLIEQHLLYCDSWTRTVSFYCFPLMFFTQILSSFGIQ